MGTNMQLIAASLPAKGFTLAEVLVALGILAVIATFTIPKIITSQQKNTYNAIAKENVAMVTAAYQQYQHVYGATSSTKISDLTPYMNYLAPSTSLAVDDVQGSNSFACAAAYPCLILHNGSVLHYSASASFGGTATNRGIWFHIDPNGTYSGTTNSDDKAAGFFLYYNGRVADEGNILAGTANSVQSYSPNSSKVPPWFQW